MGKELSILILEDNPDDVELLKHELRRGGIEFLHRLAATRAAFLRELDDCVPDIILADYKLPSFDGLTALSIAREKCPDTPFIFVSGTLGEDTAIEALKTGATDYVLKQRLSRLIPVCNRALQEAGESRRRKMAEAALRESEERYRTLFETSPDAIVLTDLDGRIMMVNRQAVALYGGTHEELKGKNVIELVVPEEAVKAKEIRQMAFFAENIKNVEHRVLKKDGSIFQAEISISTIKDLQERPYATITIIKDISERKKLEWQLFHAQKLLAIGQLAGGVAHDFNNILTAIIGYANLSQRYLEENDPVMHNLHQILEASERAAYLIRSLLTFSRRQIINPKPVNLNELIKNLEKFLKRIIGEDLELKTYQTEKELIIMADGGQIEQVLMNLATNARDAMPEGGILTLETDLVNLDNRFVQSHGYGTPGVYALLSVADTGIGMDEATSKEIFNPYFTTKEVGKGTGLGLAITYGIVKQHNGFINVYSEPDRGTTFRIYLPLSEAEHGKVVEKDLVAAVGGTETILLAEDDEIVRKLILTVLEQSGYKVIEAVDGEDAIQKFVENKNNVQLLLLDVIMPRKHGKDAYEEIKRIRPDVRALFSSGYTANIIQKKGILEEGIDFIGKPILPSELLKKVREVLGRH